MSSSDWKNIAFQPTQLKSPAHILTSRIGTCFELSTLLVSLLVGNGHDVYVVSGFATKQCCQNDQTYTNCAYNLEREFVELLGEPESPKVELFDVEDDLGISKFWRMMEQREKTAQDEKQQQKAEQERLHVEKLEEIPIDSLYGNRIHSWVLLINDDKTIQFIEPTTGIIHESNTEQYITIESIWNHENYWVNMKPNVPVKELSFDLNDLQTWEHLLVAEPWSVYSQTLKFDEKSNILALKHFKMLLSWVPQLEISEENLEEKFPKGSKVVYYRKTKYERFNKSFTSDGMICCITRYKDYDFDEPQAEVKFFYDRADKLEKIKIHRETGRIIEEFDYDREDTLMKLEYFKDEKPFWNNLKMQFYHLNRLDNMISLKATSDKIQINFINRLDHLLSYTVGYNMQTTSENMKHIKDFVTEITEKFSKTNTSDDIDTRQYSADQIFTTYHFKDNEIFQCQRRYRKPTCLSCEAKSIIQCECKNNAKFKNKMHEIEYQKLLKAEKTCLNSVWNILNEINKICNQLINPK